MSKVAIGSIPAKITYISREATEVPVGCQWDIDYSFDGQSKNIKESVNATFPAASDDAKALARGIAWATSSYATYDFATNTYDTKTPTYFQTEVDNVPIKNVRVLSLEERSQGGRAYKVLIGKFYVDLREDVLMDTLLQVGVSPGGILHGEYIWVKSGSQMKLIRVGSELHKLITEFAATKDMKPISKGLLDVGGVYQNRKKEKYIFLGYVNTTSTNFGQRTANGKPTFNPAHFPLKKVMLFFALNAHDSQANQIKQMNGKISESRWSFSIKKTHTFIEKVEQLVIAPDFIEKLRARAHKEIKQQIVEYTKNTKDNGWNLQSNLIGYSELLNIYKSDAEPVELFDVKTYLLFS